MRIAPLAALLAGAATTSYSQPPAQQVPAAVVGTVTGRVIETRPGDQAIAIPRALIILKQGQGLGGTGAYTDDKGNYSLQAQPGAYSVTVERNGYVTSRQSKARAITVQANQTTTVADLELIRTAAISGRILDADGEPIPHISVQLHSVTEKKAGMFLGGSTDDRGTYRIFQVPPGKYSLLAVYQAAFQQREVKLQTANGKSEESYSTTYFPGTLDAAQAAPIDMQAGADIGGYDIQLQRLHAVEVRGRVSGMDAIPLSIVMIMLQPVGSQPGTVRDTVVRERSGEFSLSGVPPGKYNLTAHAPDLSNRGTGPSAQRVIEVGQSDLEGIELSLAAPQAINGLIVAPEGRQVPRGLVVVLSSRERATQQAGGFAQVGSDGTFMMPAAAAGEYRVELGATSSIGAGEDLYVSAIRRGDEDVLTKGLNVGSPSGERIEIVLKPNGGTVEVTVRSPKGEPLPETSVALLPDPPRREQTALYGTCVTDARGACTLHGMAPGAYHAFAAAQEARIDFRDPDSTKDLEKQAKAVKITEGDRQMVELELAPDEQ